MAGIIIDAKKFDSMYCEYKLRFTVIANSYVRDYSLAEDLVADSFMNFWENRSEIDLSSGSIPSYILGTVRHKCLDALRKQQIQLSAHQTLYRHNLRNIQANLDSLEECDLSKILFRKEVEDIFRKRMNEVPEISARIFMANRFEGLTYQEIATRHNISVRKVTREIQRCLKLLREDLGGYLPMALLLFPRIFEI
ncbi:MAG: RNA polymerase sigma-70 factor [Bacteroidales bacterium]|nr:RNA polymerase sigma-70 factor [Bacteroidales bacterium]